MSADVAEQTMLGVHFFTANTTVAEWLSSFEVTVTFQSWQPGVHVLLNFFGDHLVEHPLKVLSIDPQDVVDRNTMTTHSIDLTLRSSPVRTCGWSCSMGWVGLP